MNNIHVYVKGNTRYNVKDKRLTIYNGIHTTPVIKKTYFDSYQISKTRCGSIYITVPPTHFDLKKRL